MKTLVLFTALFSFAAHAQTTRKYECATGNDLGVQELTIVNHDNGITTFEAKTVRDHNVGFITLLVNNGQTSSVATVGPNGNEYVFIMEKDPYEGKVGTFIWTYFLPEALVQNQMMGDIPANLLPQLSWAGTPEGAGNNPGIGRVQLSSCKSL